MASSTAREFADEVGKPGDLTWQRLSGRMTGICRSRGQAIGRRATAAVAAVCLLALSAAALVLLSRRTSPRPAWVASSSLAAAGACLLGWLVGGRAGRPSFLRAARMLDAVLATDDLLATAVGCGLTRSRSPFADFVARAALGRLERAGAERPEQLLEPRRRIRPGRPGRPHLETLALWGASAMFTVTLGACLVTGWGLRWHERPTLPLLTLSQLEQQAESLQREAQEGGFDSLADVVSRLGEVAGLAAAGTLPAQEALDELEGLSGDIQARSFALSTPGSTGTRERAGPGKAAGPGKEKLPGGTGTGADREKQPGAAQGRGSEEAGATRTFEGEQLRRVVSSLSAADLADAVLGDIATDLRRAAGDSSLSEEMRSQLKRAADMLERGDLDAARQILEELSQKLARTAQPDQRPDASDRAAREPAERREREQNLLKEADDLIARARKSLEDMQRMGVAGQKPPDDEDALAFSRRKTSESTGSERQKAGVVPMPQNRSDREEDAGHQPGKALAEGQAAPGTERDNPREEPWARPDLPPDNRAWVHGQLGEGSSEAIVASVKPAPHAVELGAAGTAGAAAPGAPPTPAAGAAREAAVSREDVPPPYLDMVRRYFGALSNR